MDYEKMTYCKNCHNVLVLIIISVLLFSCSEEKQKVEKSSEDIIITDSLNIIPINHDSLEVITPGLNGVPFPEKIEAGIPKVALSNTNIHQVTGLEEIPVSNTYELIPGKDSLLLPEIIPINFDSLPVITAGIPDIIPVKDPYMRDKNPDNFSYFSKMQGLKHDVIRCIYQDRAGNIWFGTDGAASKYDGKSFTHFTTEQGLSNSSVRSILEDRSGNIWFGTYGGGVNKYDGKNFTYFTTEQGLLNNYVRAIIEDRSGNIWFGTDEGITKFNGKSFTHFTTEQGLSKNGVNSIFEDQSGNLWFGTYGGGVNKYNGESFTHFTTEQGLSNNQISSILEDRFGNLWIGIDRGGVNKFDGKTFTYFTTEHGLINNRIINILEDRSGNLWFVGTGVISKYDGNIIDALENGEEILQHHRQNLIKKEGKYVRTLTHYTKEQGFTDNFVFSIFEDRSENFWLGTYGGISKYNGKLFTHFTTEQGLSNNTIFSILEDKSGNLWFCTEGGGVCKYDGRSFSHYSTEQGLLNNSVFSMHEDRSGNIWFGVYGGLSKFDGECFTNFTEEQGFPNNFVFSIFEDRSGNLWFGNNNGVAKYDGISFTHFTSKQGLSNNAVLAIFEDRSGNIWFGTFNGLSKYDGKSFTNFTTEQGLSNNYVRAILEDQSGNLWLGTYGGGVCKYDGRSFTHFTTEHGLPNNYVFGMLLDKNDNIWFGTRFGLCKLSAQKRERLLKILDNDQENQKIPENEVFFKSYTYHDGFLGMGVNGGGNGKTILEASDGTIWIACNDRLTAYHPEGDITDTIPPNVQLTGIELFDENIQWMSLENKDTSFTLENGIEVSDFSFDRLTKWYNLPENLSLAHNNNSLTFNFIGITSQHPKKVKYQFMLEGMDRNWSAITSKTYASYGNLPHGTYTFKVKAMNSEGYWSNEFTYTFEIRPPWWKTWWFKTIYISLAVILLLGFYLWRTASLRKRQKELEEEVKKATHEIKEKNKKLNLQNKEIEDQRILVVEQKEHLEEIYKEVSDSINYAKRIQTSALPDISIARKHISDIFVLFKPHSVVSGDFYWFDQVDNQFVITVADCTGHGVPGGFMSMMGMSLLKEIVVNNHITQPDIILGKLRTEVIKALGQTGEAGEQKDGMDMSLCSINTETKMLQWAGANNSLLLIRNGELTELQPDKMPIAIYEMMDEFTLHEIQLKEGDVIYLIGDGYPDQFGGPKGKKFMSKNLKQLLLEISTKSMQEQQKILEDRLSEWMNYNGEKYEQVDDITVMGIKI